MRHHNVSRTIERAITQKLLENHTALIITGRSSRMQDLVMCVLKELGFDIDDIVVYHDKIELSW